MTPTSSATNSAPTANRETGQVPAENNGDDRADGPLLGRTFAHAPARKDFDQLAAVLCERAGQIDWMRIMCSGFRAP
jgi:hypothetical protein